MNITLSLANAVVNLNDDVAESVEDSFTSKPNISTDIASQSTMATKATPLSEEEM